MAEPIMEVNVCFDSAEISVMESPLGKVCMIPFYGDVASELFTGKILPGACDVQVTNAGGIRHMCAQYMFESTDREGNACHLFVKNDGFFEPDSEPHPFRTCPTIMTDSPALAPYLTQARFRTEGWPKEDHTGVIIKFFDVLED